MQMVVFCECVHARLQHELQKDPEGIRCVAPGCQIVLDIDSYQLPSFSKVLLKSYLCTSVADSADIPSFPVISAALAARIPSISGAQTTIDPLLVG